ncbi:C-type lectin 37Db-like [Glossina fuscipes]|uniref:C-type lectin 37Db-like n=1 Tax=Glossina fuscipes TaxID=7396 RepID=A0A9C5Z162_9MUSC|nr:C-type lectin 37Db-like [Glossina fuscipes]KAI9579507.1 hypothetical protein GQX74_006044 [Glossina fuscipes]
MVVNMLKSVLHIYLLTTSVSLICGSKPEILVKTMDDIISDFDYEPYKLVGEKLLYFGQVEVNWFKANDICHTMNGYLTSIENEREMNAITEYLNTNLPNVHSWWVSGNDLASEGNFVWANTGTSMNYSLWSREQPDNYNRGENCVHVCLYDHGYKMNDWECRHESNFICEHEKPIAFSVNVLRK